jgi:radical SAM superfamily enzyme YgiQ (UPF0313 family)
VNILLISTNRSKQPFPVMPLGTCIVAEAVEKAGHRVRLLDLMFCEDPLPILASELKECKYDVIGLSVRNIDNNDMKSPAEFFSDLSVLIKIIRQNSHASIVLGGSAVSVMPEELLRYSETQLAVLGDGETVFPELLKVLSDGKNLEHVPGVATYEHQGFRQKASFLPPLRSCLIPDFCRWINIKSYLSNLSTVPIQSKRGCPYQCIYCTYPMGEGREYRLCEPESVVDAIKRSVSSGLRDFEFVDNVFNSPYEHAMAICECLSMAHLNVSFQSLELNPLFIDDDLLSAMEHAGFTGIGITVESASGKVLYSLKKGFMTEHVHRAAQIVRRHKLPCVWIFMLGGPGETEKTVQETLNFAEKCISPRDVAFFNVGIRIYPRTELENLAREQGVLALSNGEMLKPVFYLSPQLDKEWLIKELQTAMDTHMNFISSDSLSFPYLPSIHRLGYRLGIRPPLWKHTRFIRRGLRLFGVDA